jgi:prepilin-type N-terminal cleavage/methylation domain-containing protein
MKNGILHRKGLTLVEVAIATLLMGIVMVAALNTVGGVFKTRQASIDMQVAPILAGDLMSEIMQLAFTDPEEPDGPVGTEAGESATTRAGFDDVDDYHGWDSSSPVWPDGTSLGIGDGWQREVSVAFVEANTLANAGFDTGLKLITVTVTSPTGNVSTMQTLRSRAGLVEQSPSSDTTYVTGCQMEVRTGTALDVVSGTTIKNHATDQ